MHLSELESFFENMLQDDIISISSSELFSTTVESMCDDLWEIEIHIGKDINLQTLNCSITNDHREKIIDLFCGIVEDKDWIAEYQSQIKPIQAAEFFISNINNKDLCPDNLIPIIIESSRAFGTGSHETTIGCIEALSKLKTRMNKPGNIRPISKPIYNEEFLGEMHTSTAEYRDIFEEQSKISTTKLPLEETYLSNKQHSKPIYNEEFLGEMHTSTAEYRDIFEEQSKISTTKLPLEIEFRDSYIIDIGTGSGILSLASKALWPSHKVFGCDIEDSAIESAESNLAHNDVGEILFYLSDEANAAKPKNIDVLLPLKFDLVIANILSGPLIAMSSQIKLMSHQNTAIILSGFLNYQKDEIISKYNQEGFTVSDEILHNDWVTLTFVSSSNN